MNANNGTYTSVTVTAATSFATGVSGSTFGALNATPFKLWVTAWNNGGTVALGVGKPATSKGVTAINEGGFPASGVFNACTNASSAGLIYTTAGLSSTPIRILGYLEWSTGLTVAGVWNVGPTIIQMAGRGVKRPGEIVQGYADSFAAGSGSSTASTSFVDTNVTAPFTLSSAANSVAWRFAIETTVVAATELCTLQMTRGGVGVGATVPGAFGSTAAAYVNVASLFGTDFPGSTGPLQFTVRAKSSSVSASCIWNDGNGGGAISLAEIQN